MAYSWTDPVIDREDGTAMMTYTDMNRITQNIGYLQQKLYGIATISQTSWTQDDIITATFWSEMLDDLEELRESAEVSAITLTSEMIYDNINNVERLTLEIYQAVSGVTYEELTDGGGNSITNENLEAIEVPIYA